MEVVNNIAGAPAPVGPYSQAVRAGNLLFCAGQIALDPATGKLIDGDVAAQTELVLKNLRAVLEGAGSGFDRVAFTTIFLTDISHGAVVNPIYARYINGDAPPARQTVAVKQLPLNALVEISLIAAL